MGTFKVSKMEDKKPSWAMKLTRGSGKKDCYATGGAIGAAMDDSGAQKRPAFGNVPMHSRGATGKMKMGGMMKDDDAIPTKKMPAMNKAKENKGITEKFSGGGQMQFSKASSPSKEPKQGQFSKKEANTGYSGPGQFDRAEANPKSFAMGGQMGQEDAQRMSMRRPRIGLANPMSKGSAMKHGGRCDKRAMGGVGKIKQGIIKE